MLNNVFNPLTTIGMYMYMCSKPIGLGVEWLKSFTWVHKGGFYQIHDEILFMDWNKHGMCVTYPCVHS